MAMVRVPLSAFLLLVTTRAAAGPKPLSSEFMDYLNR